MPTPLVVNDLLRITVATRVPSKAQTGINVLHYKVTATGAGNLEQIPLAFYNRVVTQYCNWLPTVARFSGVSVSRIGMDPAGPFYQVFSQSGLNGAEIAPLQASGLIRLTTGGDTLTTPATPPGKGRVYIPFLAIAAYDAVNGIVGTAGMSRLEAIRAVLGPTMTLTGGIGIKMIVRRTKTNPSPAPPTLLGYTDVTALTALRAIATQRRRGDFGRINAAFGGII